MKIAHCPGCNAERSGMKSKVEQEHTCGSNRVIIPLKNHKGSATYVGKPTQDTIDAVNEMADLAYKMKKH